MRKVCEQYGIGIECIIPDCTGTPRLHHIVPRAKGGTNAITNLMPICEKHERNVHTSKAKERRYKKLITPINVGYVPLIEYKK